MGIFLVLSKFKTLVINLASACEGYLQTYHFASLDTFPTVLDNLNLSLSNFTWSRDKFNCLIPQKEAQFYLLEDVIRQCQEVIDREASDSRDHFLESFKFKIPVLTLPMPEKFFLSIKAPVVRFAYNRSNNKYSYTE